MRNFAVIAFNAQQLLTPLFFNRHESHESLLDAYKNHGKDDLHIWVV